MSAKGHHHGTEEIRSAKVWATLDTSASGWGEMAAAAERMDAMDRTAQALGLECGYTGGGDYHQLYVHAPMERVAALLDLLAFRFGETEFTVDVDDARAAEELASLVKNPDSIGAVDFDL